MRNQYTSESAVAASQYYKESEYWLKKLSGNLEKTAFPHDNKIDASPGTDGPGTVTGRLDFAFSNETSSRLQQVSNGSDIRLHIIAAAAVTALLYKYTGHTDIIIGSPVLKQENNARFINTVLILRNNFTPGITFRGLLREVKNTISEATEHQNYPIETLLFQLNMPFNEKDLFSLFEVAVLLENIHDKSYMDHILTGMCFSFSKNGREVKGQLEYNAALYREAAVRQMVTHLLCFMEAALSQPDLQLNAIGIQPEKELKKILYEFNHTAADYPKDKTLHRLFEEQVLKTPDNPAVVTAKNIYSAEGNVARAKKETEKSITYSQLNEKSNQLARVLREKGVKPNTIVALLLENSIETITAILGVLKAGGAYLPIDFNQPVKRKKYILEESGAQLLLSQQRLLSGHPGISSLLPAGHILDMLDGQLYCGDTSNLPAVSQPGDLAYIIYTSGTTGTPRGVMVENRGLVNYICWAIKKYACDHSSIFPLYSNIAFDLTVTSIFTPLVTGHLIVVYGGAPAEELVIDGIIKENKASVVKLTPSHLKLIRHGTFETGNLRRFIVGGEALETSLAGEILQKFGAIDIYNEYGPTEAVVGCMLYKFAPGENSGSTVPIGVPADNVQIYVLDEYRQPLPMGVVGELHISGDGVARGYLNNPRATMDKFIPNPFIPGKKMYRTGDLARLLQNGNIEYIGRKDQQVKIRGYRVELTEIENTLKHYKVEASVKTILTDDFLTHWNPKKIQRCQRCLLTADYPGSRFDQQGVCSICREYERYELHTANYFKTRQDLEKRIQESKGLNKNQSKYDCLLLFSGGKDSSYALYRLVDMGFNVLTFTFDNGYISDTAFSNIKRITSLLHVDNTVRKASNIKELFVESIKSNHNVCHGCWYALNTIGAKAAEDNGINIVISGLSRGQIFDMRLHGLFRMGVFSEEEIEQRLQLFRKTFHSADNQFAQLLGVSLESQEVENIHFVDFFRYDDVSVRHIKEYLRHRQWVQPRDTGFCSSNCMINDVGIYMHLRGTGHHAYEAPLSWDIRFGVLSRQAGLGEVGFNGDLKNIHQILEEIGFYKSFSIKDAVVIEKQNQTGDKYLCAYYVSEKEFNDTQLKEYLSQYLPGYMIPSHFMRIAGIPLTPNGKLDIAALPEPQLRSESRYVAPETDKEKIIADIWKRVLGLDKVGTNDNFFDIGGNSINIITLFFEINKEFGKDMQVARMFQYPTVASLAKYIADDEHKESIPPAVAVPPTVSTTKDPPGQLDNFKNRLKQRRNRTN